MSMRLATHVLMFVLVAATATPSAAFDFPHRKPGLWTISMSVDGAKGAMAATKMCIDAGTDAKMMQMGLQRQQNACEPPAIQGSGAVRTIDSVCHIAGATHKSHMVMTFTGDSAYHLDIATQISPPFAGHSGMHMTQDAQWAGPCPADMKPGDMMMGGMKFNVLNSTPMPQSHLTQAQIDAIMKAHQH